MPTVQLYDNNHSGLTADITFSAITGGSSSLGTAQYSSSAQAAKNLLTGSTLSGGYGWTITDGGPV